MIAYLSLLSQLHEAMLTDDSVTIFATDNMYRGQITDVSLVACHMLSEFEGTYSRWWIRLDKIESIGIIVRSPALPEGEADDDDQGDLVGRGSR
jgi:hypothetical protein